MERLVSVMVLNPGLLRLQVERPLLGHARCLEIVDRLS